MKSVGETMAIGMTFKESFQKALRSLEIGSWGFGGGKLGGDELPSKDVIKGKLVRPNAERVFYLRYAFTAGFTAEEIFELTKIDPWFIRQLEQISELENGLKSKNLDTVNSDSLRLAKEYGFSDRQLGWLLDCPWDQVKANAKA